MRRNPIQHRDGLTLFIAELVFHDRIVSLKVATPLVRGGRVV